MFDGTFVELQMKNNICVKKRGLSKSSIFFIQNYGPLST